MEEEGKADGTWNSEGKKVGIWISRKFLMFEGDELAVTREHEHAHTHARSWALIAPSSGQHQPGVWTSALFSILFSPETKLRVRAALQTHTPPSTFIFHRHCQQVREARDGKRCARRV